MRNLRFGIVVVLLSGLGAIAGTFAANADTRDVLNNLFSELKLAKNERAAIAIEGRIWQTWYMSGDRDIDLLMRQGRIALGERNMREALDVADEVVKRKPGYSEGWNFRATALYVAGKLDASLEDVARTLALEPRHFGALSGTALIMLQKGENAAALTAIKKALEIHPYLRGASDIIRQAGGAEIGDPI
ncbi:MAG: tetratricopeptide repeat protein [Pseudomonadota bacterium]